MNRHEYEIPVVKATFSLRSPRAVALLHPFQLPLVLILAGLSIVFTIWPEALNHNPISFENRGIIHHVWHYTLLTGALLSTAGLFMVHSRRLQLELVGLCLLTGALVMNLVAVIAEAESVIISSETPSGLGMALRFGVITGLIIRLYIVAFEPTVEIPIPPTKESE